MYINEHFSDFYHKYGTKLYEESQNVLPKDTKERLKVYLNNTYFLTELAKQVQTIKNGDQINLKLDKTKYGILDKDMIFVYCDKTIPTKPKFQIWIKNDQEMLDGINFSLASDLIFDAIDGAGTWEENIAAVGGALYAIAMDRGADVSTYFKELDIVYTKRYNDTLKDAIDGDLDGNEYSSAAFLFKLEENGSISKTFSALTGTASPGWNNNSIGMSVDSWNLATTSQWLKNALSSLKKLNIKNKESIADFSLNLKKFSGKESFGYILSTILLSIEPNLITKLNIEYKKINGRGLYSLMKETDSSQIMALAYLIGTTGEGNSEFSTKGDIGTIADIADKLLGKSNKE